MGRNALIKKVKEAGDFVMGDDGFWIFWPTTNRGGYSDYVLRWIADELENRNKDWAHELAEGLRPSEHFIEQGLENLRREARKHGEKP